MKPSANSIGGSSRILPFYSVASQLKNSTPVGIEIISVVALKNGSSTDAGREHVVRPDRERQRRDHQERQHDASVAEEGLAGEHREDLAHDAPGAEDQHVHLGVAEEPEHVLPQQDLAAVRGIEEEGAQVPVGEQHDQPGREHGRRQDHQQRGGQHAPHEDRQAHHGHPRCPHPQDRHDEVDRAQDRGGADDQQPQYPQILAGAQLSESGT